MLRLASARRLGLFMAAPLVLASIVAAPAFAQQPTERPTLTANGEGVVYAAPDIALVTLGVVSQAETPAAALDANNADMQSVIDATLAAGVAEDDIATTNFSINPVYAPQDPNNFQAQPRIIGYEVRNDVTIRIRGLDASGTVLDQVVRAGANQVTGLSFDLAEPQAARDDAIRAAIADARRRAELMAEAAGVRLGRVVSITTFDGAAPQFEMRAMAAQAVPVMGGQRSISANATLIFEIAAE